MPVEGKISPTLIDIRPVIKTAASVETGFPERAATLTSTLADAKEFSPDTAEAVDSEGPYSVTCGGVN